MESHQNRGGHCCRDFQGSEKGRTCPLLLEADPCAEGVWPNVPEAKKLPITPFKR